jgi:hypothetical protein
MTMFDVAAGIAAALGAIDVIVSFKQKEGISWAGLGVIALAVASLVYGRG